MEPAKSTGNFNRKITVADSNNIIAILDLNIINSKYQFFEQDYIVEIQAVLEDLKVTVGLLSLAEAPWPDTNFLMSESAQMAEIAKIRTQGQKISLGLYTAIGNGPWQYESEVVLQNQGGAESHVPILVPFLSSNETLLISGDFKLGVKIEPKWNQPLKANDYLVVKGNWRQVVSFSKKKDDDVEFLAARIEALELALYGRLTEIPANSLLGRNAGSGNVEIIPQNQFATPAQINSVINTLAPINNPTFTGNLSIETPGSVAAASTGKRSFPYNGGWYEDFKVATGENLRFRCGAGTEPSYTRNFMIVTGADGSVNFPCTTVSTSTTTGALLASSMGITGRLSANLGCFSTVCGAGNQTFDFTDSTIKMGVGTAGQDAVFSLHCSGTGLGVFGFDYSANRFVIGSNQGKTIDFCTNVGGTSGADNLAAATAVLKIQNQNIICPVLPTSSAGLPSGAIWRSGNQILVV